MAVLSPHAILNCRPRATIWTAYRGREELHTGFGGGDRRSRGGEAADLAVRSPPSPPLGVSAAPLTPPPLCPAAPPPPLRRDWVVVVAAGHRREEEGDGPTGRRREMDPPAVPCAAPPPLRPLRHPHRSSDRAAPLPSRSSDCAAPPVGPHPPRPLGAGGREERKVGRSAVEKTYRWGVFF
ncbi:Os01g0624600 [Oryza sativa Japonica Group]|uniref:Os01g0624600 protein n=1 Tax=Oryza sativa subsp. japonica TaxID=39947 RepID=A0A0P0V5G9_ORYSJ|nr:Os01g0624600 [Oryza sativa Japonica Group]